MHDDAHGEAEKAVDLAHPLGIAFGQVVVHRDNVNTAASQRIEVAGKGGDEGFAFTGFHFGDLALVEHRAADQLHIEVAHADDAAASFADHGEGFGQEIVEGSFFCGVNLLTVGEPFERFLDAGLELGRLPLELVIGQALDRIIEAVDLGEGRKKALDGAFVGGTKNLGDNVC